ncbi:hypothetical protein [Croceimicrobium sp.]|uniref:hypothetical protein n=1 Tax=Croceimicrobium sp. TaxID=2828340 RepID=UPI003BA92497
MRKHLDIELKDQGNVKALCVQYFTDYGFKLIRDRPNHLRFKRGSVLLNFFTFNPLRWKTEVNIEVLENSLHCDFTISLIGQVPTKTEEESWDAFVENFRSFIKDPNFDFRQRNQSVKNKVKGNNWAYLKYAILVGLLIAIPLAIIGHFLGRDDLAPVGAAIGVAMAVMSRIQKEKTTK